MLLILLIIIVDVVAIVIVLNTVVAIVNVVKTVIVIVGVVVAGIVVVMIVIVDVTHHVMFTYQLKLDSNRWPSLICECVTKSSPQCRAQWATLFRPYLKDGKVIYVLWGHFKGFSVK